MTTVTLAGNPINISGQLPHNGQKAPPFTLVNTDLKDVSLSDFGNKRKVLNIVPSLDTSICATSTRAFNQKAASLQNTVVLVISGDLPFAASRFCTTENLERVVPLSFMRGRRFLKDYGVEISNGPLEGLAARAVVVLDGDNVVIHSQLVPEIKQEPDYHAALAVL